MDVPRLLLKAIIEELEKSLADDDRVHAAAVHTRRQLDHFLEKSSRQRVDKSHRIDELRRVLEADPHGVRTPLPPPALQPPPAPPGMQVPARLTPPPLPRKR